MKSNCPPKTVLEGFSLEGKMPDDIEDHVGSCSPCQERLRQWTEERKSFLERYPFQKLWNVLEARKKRAGFWEKFVLTSSLRTGLAAAAVAALMVFVLWHYRQPPEFLTKGGIGLGFYVSHQERIEKGKDGMLLTPGDELQFVYSSERERFLLLFGVEADRTMTVYYPSGGSESGPIKSGRKNKVPEALRWQPSSPYERFFALFSEKPISLEEVKTVLQTASEGSLPGKSIEEMTRFPLPYVQASVIVYRKNGK